MDLARGKAAQAWQSKKTNKKAINPDLCEEFAKVINKIWSKLWLENATTGELLEELKARISVNGMLKYKTVGGG